MNAFYQAICNVYMAVSSIYDKRLKPGVDFARWMTREELKVTEKEGNQYQPSPFELNKLLRKIALDPHQTVLDVGCGKGRAMYTFAQQGFTKVDGIDLSETLVNTANSNFKLLEVSNCHSYAVNALDYDGYGDYDIFYFYNPVPVAIFKEVLAKITAARAGRGRETRIISMNPSVYEQTILDTGLFEVETIQKSIVPWFELRVYRCAAQ